MSIQAQIDALEALAEIDLHLARLESELGDERSNLGGKRQQLAELQVKLESIQGSITEMEKVRNDLVGEARQMSVQMERSREKLGRSRSEREVNAAQREVEELRKLFRDREIESQKVVGLIEQAQVDELATDEQRQQLAAELGESQGDVETRLGQLEKESGEYRRQREAAAKKVPPALYRRYEMIRKRRGSAIAHTTHGTCSACHISLAPMMFQVLRRQEGFDQCPSCNRIIYFKVAADEGMDGQANSDGAAASDAEAEAQPNAEESP